METQAWAVGLILGSTIIGSFGSLLFKKGADKLSLSVSALLRNWMIPAGFILYVLSAALFVYALQGGELSVLYPLVSLAYIWMCLLSMRFLGERMNRLKWAGVAFIVAGVALIGVGGS